MSVMERRLYALQIQSFLISSKSGAFQWILQIRLEIASKYRKTILPGAIDAMPHSLSVAIHYAFIYL